MRDGNLVQRINFRLKSVTADASLVGMLRVPRFRTRRREFSNGGSIGHRFKFPRVDGVSELSIVIPFQAVVAFLLWLTSGERWVGFGPGDSACRREVSRRGRISLRRNRRARYPGVGSTRRFGFLSFFVNRSHDCVGGDNGRIPPDCGRVVPMVGRYRNIDVERKVWAARWKSRNTLTMMLGRRENTFRASGEVHQ